MTSVPPSNTFPLLHISTHTLRGERDKEKGNFKMDFKISTHTLRGERDLQFCTTVLYRKTFQLTCSVGSVTAAVKETLKEKVDFNSHAPWGA